MSHYCVAVFSKEPYDISFDELLAPFDEADHMYFTKIRVEENDVMQKWNTFSTQNPKHTFDDYLSCFGYKKDCNGYYYECNPDGKYDYYSLDGKSYMEEPKWKQKYDNDECRYRKSQLRFNGPIAFVKGLYQAISSYIALQRSDFYSDAYKNANKNFIRYIKTHRHNCMPYAFVDPNGEWYAPGDVGWFAMSDDTPDSYLQYAKCWKNFIKHADDCYVSFVDCHI